MFLTAPGKEIISLDIDNSVCTESGTSFSAPIVSGVVALIKEICPDYTTSDVMELLIKTSVDAGDSGYDVKYGYGIINVENIIKELEAEIPDFIITEGIRNQIKRLHIHNNLKNSVAANAFFVTEDRQSNFSDVKISEDIILASGVTNLPLQGNFNAFFLWNNNLRPYVGKYIIE